jgi:hypothetical protein
MKLLSFYDCTIGELTDLLQAALRPVTQNTSAALSDHQPTVTVEQTQPIRSAHLQRWLWERRIPLHVAQLYCLEAWYYDAGKLLSALAFRNDAGGYELFHRRRRCRASPSGPSFLKSDAPSIAIFQHALDLLTFAAIFPGPVSHFPDFLVLNAPVAFPVVRPILQPYRMKHLFLPNDTFGTAFTSLAMNNLKSCHDHRRLYKGYPSLNDWVCRIGTSSPPRLSS